MDSHRRIANASALFLQEVEGASVKEDKIVSYIQERDDAPTPVTQFPKDAEFLNCSQSLSFDGNLKGKLVLLDFFTYCCINCMHVLPDLHRVEKTFSKEQVVVIGVHSAKFQNEKNSANILNAMLRYGIEHAVVNDGEAVMWNQMGIQCWPTFVIVSPDGNCLLHLVGEGHGSMLLDFIATAVKHYQSQGKFKHHLLAIEPKIRSLSTNVLRFPGKLCTVDDGFAIADSGNNRIVIISKEGIVKKVFGGLLNGFQDGSTDKARFDSPQGLAFSNGQLFVADTNNHCIRKIDLEQGKVTTIVGTGKQGTDKEGGKKGTEQEISSPWDVAVGPAPGLANEEKKNVLYIAAAGTHQIWCYFLEDGSWIKKETKTASCCLRFAGSGNEENRNNSYPHKASFAQPSGLTVAHLDDCKRIYVADSESSSVRSVDLRSGAVKACAGGDIDPMNLFSFGDEDGKGVQAKLQHPLDVAWNPRDGRIYVADSYNHKIKVIDISSRACSTLAGTGFPGFKDGSCEEAQFDEPGGLAVYDNGTMLAVADTNNNAVRLINLEKKKVEKLHVFNEDEIDSMVISSKPAVSTRKDKQLTDFRNSPSALLPSAAATLSNPVSLDISIKLPPSCYYTEGAVSKCSVTIFNRASGNKLLSQSEKLDDEGGAVVQFNPKDRSELSVWVEATVFYCSPDGVCLMNGMLLQQDIVHDENATRDNTVQLTHFIS